MQHRAADILAGGIAEIEAAHQMFGFGGLYRRLAAVQVGNQCGVAGGGKAVGNTADLVVQPPPFLDHDQARCARLRRTAAR